MINTFYTRLPSMFLNVWFQLVTYLQCTVNMHSVAWFNTVPNNSCSIYLKFSGKVYANKQNISIAQLTSKFKANASGYEETQQLIAPTVVEKAL